MPPEKERILSGREFARAWQDAFGEPDQLEVINFTGETNVTGGEPIQLEVFHPNPATARAAALVLRRTPAIHGRTDLESTTAFALGKPELKITLKDYGLTLGLTAEEVARQIRHRYHGAEALRFVRDGSEVRVMVRLNEEERRRGSALQEVMLKGPSGVLVPLTEIAGHHCKPTLSQVWPAETESAFSPLPADMGFGIHDEEVEDALEETIIPALTAEFPGVVGKVRRG